MEKPRHRTRLASAVRIEPMDLAPTAAYFHSTYTGLASRGNVSEPSARACVPTGCPYISSTRLTSDALFAGMLKSRGGGGEPHGAYTLKSQAQTTHRPPACTLSAPNS